MSDRECVAFLQDVLPALGLRWAGYRKVRGQVCKRLRRRLAELELDDLTAYRAFLDAHPEEWEALDARSGITISRFHRDRAVFEEIRTVILPALARQAGERALRAWSAGCASGEEPWSLRLAWDLDLPAAPEGLEIVATDFDSQVLERARRGCYPAGSLRDAPPHWRGAFRGEAELLCIADEHRRAIRFVQQDVRRAMPDGPFDLVLCRNVAFTYFERRLQAEVLAGILARLRVGGWLVIGVHERLPSSDGLIPAAGAPGIFRRCE